MTNFVYNLRSSKEPFQPLLCLLIQQCVNSIRFGFRTESSKKDLYQPEAAFEVSAHDILRKAHSTGL